MKTLESYFVLGLCAKNLHFDTQGRISKPMKNISRRDAFRILAGGVAASAVGGAALAQEPVVLAPEDDYFKTQARDWSLENDGVAIAITMPTTSAHDPEFLGEQITIGLGQLNGTPVNTELFSVTRDEQQGEAITFFVRGAPYGPYGLTDAAQNMANIVSDYRSTQQAALNSRDYESLA